MVTDEHGSGHAENDYEIDERTPSFAPSPVGRVPGFGGQAKGGEARLLRHGRIRRGRPGFRRPRGHL